MEWIVIKSNDDLPEYLTLILARIERGNGHRMVRIRQMGKPNEWFNEFDQSTMSMKSVEENVSAWMPLPE